VVRVNLNTDWVSKDTGEKVKNQWERGGGF